MNNFIKITKIFTVFYLVCFIPSFAVYANPFDPEIKADQTRILLQNADFNEAKLNIDALLTNFPNNPDYLLLRAYWYFYQGQLDESEKDFSKVIKEYPNYKDAQNGLNNIFEQKAEKEKGLWRFDAGYGISTFQHSSQPNWQRAFVQVTRALDDKKLFVHFRGEHFDQRRDVDALYEIGATRKFTQFFYGNVAFSGSPHPIYKPILFIRTGFDGRLTTGKQTIFPVWGVFSFQQSWYKNLENRTFSSGPQVIFSEDWNATAKMIYTYQVDGKATKGWITQLHGRIIPSLKFSIGYAVAPDLDEALITVVDTAFASLIYDISDRQSVRLDFAREDRDQSFTRNSVDVSFSYKF